METDVLLSVEEAAARLSVTRAAIYKAFSSNRLPGIRTAEGIRIAERELSLYQQRVRPEGVKPKGRPRRASESRKAVVGG